MNAENIKMIYIFVYISAILKFWNFGVLGRLGRWGAYYIASARLCARLKSRVIESQKFNIFWLLQPPQSILITGARAKCNSARFARSARQLMIGANGALSTCGTLNEESVVFYV
jgi:hypothetical protein